MPLNNMTSSILFAMPGNEAFSHALNHHLKIATGDAEIRTFPDGESFIRIDSDVRNQHVILVCTLDHPNDKFLPLMFMARTLKDLGAAKVCLVAPYLSYMRQDIRFHPGEALTSKLFAQLLSTGFDSLITIDPHLHRTKNLAEIYTIPQLFTLHATRIISDWIQENIERPLLVGPDEESEQWIAEIAGLGHFPFVIGQKKRLGDKQVKVTLPALNDLNHTPVLVDDIISTGKSMLETLKLLGKQGLENTVCIGVHALFNAATEQSLMQAGAEKIITCNTIPHATNRINLASLVASHVRKL